MIKYAMVIPKKKQVQGKPKIFHIIIPQAISAARPSLELMLENINIVDAIPKFESEVNQRYKPLRKHAISS